ncbi:MAG TPA: protein translocase subunit SecD [Kiloniellales bacterium]|nr:protein translocase subunit SecD [Kiloniellales bacterium]
MVQLPLWQRVLILAVMALGLLYALPNAVPRSTLDSLPSWLPRSQVNLGLDLRGGSYLLLEVDIAALEAEQLKDLAATVRDVLRQARIGYANLGAREGAIGFSLRDASKAAEVATLLQDELSDDVTIEQTPSGEFRVAYTERYLEERRANVVVQAVEIVSRRVDETGTREASVQRQGDLRILLQVPGADPDELKRILGTVAKMTFRFVLTDADPAAPPAGSSVLEISGEEGQPSPGKLVVEDRIMVSGESLVDAQLGYQQNEPVVTFRFDGPGGKAFCDATSNNVGRLFAIVLDNKVISYPRIREPICGGSGNISGSFTQESASRLALLLRAGALPAPLKILEERTVGPGLGADSIEAGEQASIVGIILAMAFMTAAYGLFGAFACVALLANLILLLGMMTAIGATLTLPGIAGIALTLGMAVDANVLIYERMREEQRAGRSPLLAVDAGYKRALTTIIDSNLTTLIAGILLYQFGSGPIRGFAVTLSLGLVTSMFTAIMLSRWLILVWLKRRRRVALPI